MRTLTLALILSVAAASAANEKIDFAHDVFPLLKASCAKCHTSGTYKGDLSMDTRQALVDSGAVVVGNSAESELIMRVRSDDPEVRMPASGRPLSALQVEKLSSWIDQGLPWDDGISFKASTYRAPLALRTVQLPEAHQSTHPIDRILDAYVAENDVRLHPVTDNVFMRRLYLDVLGLLPTPSELETFVYDTSSNKREVLIDSVLNNNRAYAEHWLTFWNDLLRNDYRGTGYIDGGRKAITNWLFKSLIENKPYDQFVRDLITPASGAEGFINGIKWRGRVNASQVREVQFAQNVSQVLLGTNLKCASCHDSFINDWKLTDAYGMAAIVAQTPVQMHRCDKPTGEIAKAKFLFPELGEIDAEAPREQRLAKLAALLTARENGRFTRTIVNRIWHRMLGRGLVEPVDEMERQPWSEDLLDYLAAHLIDNRYDLKSTIRLIATSRVYQSQTTLVSGDTADAYVFRGPIARRLTAEQFFDAIWRITDTAPQKSAADFGDRGGQPVRASLVNSNLLMRSLGRPNREQVVTTRPAHLSTLQALDLSNGAILDKLLARGATQLRAKFSDDAPGLIRYVYRFALSRLPTDEELTTAVDLLGETSDQSVADFLWVVAMLPEFQLVR